MQHTRQTVKTNLDAVDNVGSIRHDLAGLASLTMALGASDMHEPEAISFVARTLERCAASLGEIEQAIDPHANALATRVEGESTTQRA